MYLQLTKPYANSHQLEQMSVQARQVTTRVVANKMITIFGDYPTTIQKESVVKLLGKQFGLPQGITRRFLGSLARKCSSKVGV